MNLKDGLDTLTKIKQRKRLVLFIGSGISMNSGLPSWNDLMKQILELCNDVYNQAKKELTKVIVPTQATKRALAILEEYKVQVENAEKEIDVHPIWTVTVLKEQLKFLQDNGVYDTKVAFHEQVLQQFLSKDPHKYHDSIVNSDYPILLTSNYDDLLQKAAKKLGKKEYQYSAFDITQPEKIANKIYHNEPFIFHVHGKVKANETIEFNDIVLTKNDYQRIRKDKPAIGQLIRTIFLNYSVLFVGYGANDPHINDVVEEMSYFFPDTPIANQHFIIWNEFKGFSPVQAQYNKGNRLNFITITDWSEYGILFTELEKIK